MKVKFLVCYVMLNLGGHVRFSSVYLATMFLLLDLTNYIFSSPNKTSWTERPWHCLGRMTWPTASGLWTLKGYISMCVYNVSTCLSLNVCVFICVWKLQNRWLSFLQKRKRINYFEVRFPYCKGKLNEKMLYILQPLLCRQATNDFKSSLYCRSTNKKLFKKTWLDINWNICVHIHNQNWNFNFPVNPRLEIRLSYVNLHYYFRVLNTKQKHVMYAFRTPLCMTSLLYSYIIVFNSN